MPSRTWTIIAIAFMFFMTSCGTAEIPATPAPSSPTGTPFPVPTRLPLTSTPAPLPAGRILFYSERDGNPEIYVMNSSGGNPKRLTDNPAEDITPAFSPDGRQIVFSSNRDGNFEIYIMDADGSNQQRLTNSPANDIQPAWSPDGTKILYTPYTKSDWSDGEIFVINVDGSNPTQLTNDPADDTRPFWSSDGSKIYFSSKRDGNFEIYVMNTDGSTQQRLTNTSVNELFPCPSPDGKKIAYAVVDFSSFHAQIHVMNADGSSDVILTDQGTVNEDPVWTDDGQYIVFQSNRDGNYEVYMMKADGSDQRRLIQNSAWDGWPGWGSATTPAATPVSTSTATPTSIPPITGSGGGVIAYASMRNSDWQIYLMNADGIGQMRVTANVRGGYEPNWSPDGTKIVFQYNGLYIADIASGEISRIPLSVKDNNLPNEYLVKPAWSPTGEWLAFLNENGTRGDIYLIRPDGTDLRRLTDSNDISRDGNLVWSPDGKQLAYSAYRTGNIEVYVMEVESALQGKAASQQLTDSPPPVRNLVTSWAPDGSRFAFSSDRDRNTEIYLMNVDGSNVVRLTNNPASDTEPRWSPDGKQIAFSSNRDGNVEIYVLDVAEAIQGANDANARQLTDHPGDDVGPVWRPVP